MMESTLKLPKLTFTEIFYKVIAFLWLISSTFLMVGLINSTNMQIRETEARLTLLERPMGKFQKQKIKSFFAGNIQVKALTVTDLATVALRVLETSLRRAFAALVNALFEALMSLFEKVFNAISSLTDGIVGLQEVTWAVEGFVLGQMQTLRRQTREETEDWVCQLLKRGDCLQVADAVAKAEYIQAAEKVGLNLLSDLAGGLGSSISGDSSSVSGGSNVSQLKKFEEDTISSFTDAACNNNGPIQTTTPNWWSRGFSTFNPDRAACATNIRGTVNDNTTEDAVRTRDSLEKNEIGPGPSSHTAIIETTNGQDEPCAEDLASSTPWLANMICQSRNMTLETIPITEAAAVGEEIGAALSAAEAGSNSGEGGQNSLIDKLISTVIEAVTRVVESLVNKLLDWIVNIIGKFFAKIPGGEFIARELRRAIGTVGGEITDGISEVGDCLAFTYDARAVNDDPSTERNESEEALERAKRSCDDAGSIFTIGSDSIGGITAPSSFLTPPPNNPNQISSSNQDLSDIVSLINSTARSNGRPLTIKVEKIIQRGNEETGTACREETQITPENYNEFNNESGSFEDYDKLKAEIKNLGQTSFYNSNNKYQLVYEGDPTWIEGEYVETRRDGC